MDVKSKILDLLELYEKLSTEYNTGLISDKTFRENLVALVNKYTLLLGGNV